MTKVSLYNQSGEKVSDLDLPAEIFGVKPEAALLEQAVRTHLAGQRAPSSSTKTRAEVRGGGRKPWRQKGTGRARHGSIRSPLWSGGGVTFGPRSERNWSLKMNKKAQRRAMLMALSDKALAENILVVENLEPAETKTTSLLKLIKEILAKAGKTHRAVLVVVPDGSEAILTAGKNLKEGTVMTSSSLNTYEILKARTLVVTQQALAAIEKRLSN